MPDDNAQLRALREKVKTDRKQVLRAVLDLADAPDTDQRAAGELEFGLERIESLDRRLSALPDVEVVREPDIYEPFSDADFFVDLAATVSPTPIRGVHPHLALERLQRHQQHGQTLREIDGRAAERRAALAGIRTGRPDGVPTQSRALSAIVAGGAGEFSPPKFLTDLFAGEVRAAAPLPKLVRTLPLPPDAMELYIPRVTVSGGVVAASTENVDPPETVTGTDEIVAPVVTIEGSIPVSEQLYARGNFSSIAIPEFGQQYAEVLEKQMTQGSGSGGQMLGLLNVSTADVYPDQPPATVNTWTNSSPTVGEMTMQIGQLAANVADARELPPSACLMRPARWYWLTFNGPTNAGEPPQQLLGTGQIPEDPDTGPYGPLPGSLPVYLDSTLPDDLGAGSNQDVAIVVRGQDIILLEDEPKFSAFVDTAGGAEELTVFLAYHRYVAFFPQRTPSAIGSITGSGFVVPTGW